jgi:hypothetical protein
MMTIEDSGQPGSIVKVDLRVIMVVDKVLYAALRKPNSAAVMGLWTKWMR